MPNTRTFPNDIETMQRLFQVQESIMIIANDLAREDHQAASMLEQVAKQCHYLLDDIAFGHKS